MIEGIIWVGALGTFATVGAIKQTIEEKKAWKKENQRRFEEIKRRNRLRKIKGDF